MNQETRHSGANRENQNVGFAISDGLENSTPLGPRVLFERKKSVFFNEMLISLKQESVGKGVYARGSVCLPLSCEWGAGCSSSRARTLAPNTFRAPVGRTVLAEEMAGTEQGVRALFPTP